MFKYIYNNFKLSLKYLKEIKSYFWFSFFLFFGIAILGFVFPVFFEERIIELIAEIIEETEGLGFLELIAYIMFNNMQSAFFGVVFGIFFGIFPIMVAVINGYVLGFVSNKTAAVAGLLVLWRLLPHGIFEIPAILISIALGLRLGMFLFVYRGKNKRREFWKWIKNSFRAFILIVIPLLVIAGIIEGGLIWLIDYFVV